MKTANGHQQITSGMGGVASVSLAANSGGKYGQRKRKLKMAANNGEISGAKIIASIFREKYAENKQKSKAVEES
jgi:hypothetical protein